MKRKEIKKQLALIKAELEKIRVLLIEIMQSNQTNVSMDSTALLDEYLNGVKK